MPPDNLTRLKQTLHPGFKLRRVFRLIDPEEAPAELIVHAGMDLNHYRLDSATGTGYSSEVPFPAPENIVFLEKGFEIWMDHRIKGRYCILRYECDVSET